MPEKQGTGRRRLASRGIFTTYFNSDEEAAIVAIAEANGTSRNYVIRMAVRKLVGLPGPELQVPDSIRSH